MAGLTGEYVSIDACRLEYGTVKQVNAIAGAVAGRVGTLVLESCGHAPHIDQREKVLDAAAMFLQQVRVPR